MNNYYVYILTNHTKTVLYTGITNNIDRRIMEHKSTPTDFAYKYKAFTPIFTDTFNRVEDAIAFEKKIKGWSRSKKVEMINMRNPHWEDIRKLSS